jgi:mitochondrial intermediate peptidase
MLNRARQLVDVIVNSRSKEDLRAIVKNMDRLSDLLCQVIDMSDFIRATHPDRKICMAADKAYTDAFEYMNVLNTTSGIYEALNMAFDDQEIVSSWNAEEKAVASILHQDHEKSGINLPADQKRKFISLSNQIAQVGTQFVNSMAPAKRYLTFESSRLKGMDPMVVRELTARGRVVLPTHGLPVNHALRTVEDEYVRQELYTETRTSSPRQIGVLEEMLKLRTELAHLTGHDSFAQRALVDKMAKSPGRSFCIEVFQLKDG